MSKLIALFTLGLVLVVGGCQNKNHDDMESSTEPKKMSADACPGCPGMQTATADGKCPGCGAKAKM